MSFGSSPYERVRNAGLRIVTIRSQLLFAGWDIAALNAALQALRDDEGGVPLPNGVNEEALVMRAVFELRPQIMEQALSLYEREFKKLAPTVPVAAGAFRMSINDGVGGFDGDVIDGQDVAFTDELGGAISTQIFTIHNDGPGDLEITGITVGGDVQIDGGPPAEAWGGILPAVPFTLNNGISIEIPFDFYAGGNGSPVPAGVYNMSMSVEHDAGNEPSPFSASLTGDSTIVPSD